MDFHEPWWKDATLAKKEPIKQNAYHFLKHCKIAYYWTFSHFPEKITQTHCISNHIHRFDVILILIEVSVLWGFLGV